MRNLSTLKRHKHIFTILTLVVAVISAIASYFIEGGNPFSAKPENLAATFINVGQGDAFLLETPEGKSILIDGGEYDSYDVYLEPFLMSRGINIVDKAIITHYHSDHLGGIHELLKKGLVRKLVLPHYDDTDETRSALEKAAKKNGTDIIYASAGVSLDEDGLSIDVLHPVKGGFDGKNFHNNSSLVLKVAYGKTTFLITGDIETCAEKQILKSENVECDVLKIAHHGSSTSSSKRFIELADPTYGIISAGEGNSYGHPHNETLDLLQNEDIMIYRTDRDGDITFTVSPERIENISFSK